MKKYFLLALVVLTGIASSCKYDDDEVWDSVNDLANRVTALEAATKQLNSDIAALQSIVSALQNQVSVSKVETLADGYIIHFSDGTKATIKNGEDGQDGADGEDGKDGKDGLNAPIINVAKEGGVYYWTITIDGETEWLTDESGNKMPVSGEDGKDGAHGATGAPGKDGNTPLLRVNANGLWEVSYDNGKTYDLVNEEDGGVIAEGENGDSKFANQPIKEKDGYIVITMANGQTYQLPLLAAVKYTDAKGKDIAVDALVLEANQSMTLTYEVSQLGSKYSVEVLKQEGVTITVNENKKELKIDLAASVAKAVILYYNGNQTITSVLTIYGSTFTDSATDLQTKLSAGGVVSLTGNVTVASTLNVDANVDVILNLNGYDLNYSVTNTGASAIINNKGTLKIINSETDKEAQISFVAANPDTQQIPSYATNTISNTGTLTISENVIVTNGSDGSASYAVDNHAFFVLDGGTLIGKKCALRIAKFNPQVVKFTMNGGLIKSEKTAAWIHLSGSDSNVAPNIEVVINGGIMTSTTSTPDNNDLFYSYSFGNSHANTNITINGGEFLNGWVSIGSGYKGDAPSMIINGGYFQYDVLKWKENNDYEVLYQANLNN